MARKPLVDPTAAADRWGRRDPGRAYALGIFDYLLERELLVALWDTLDAPAGRALPPSDRQRLARQALEIIAAKDPESTAAAQARVLLSILPDHSPRAKNRLDPAIRAAARAAIAQAPAITIGQVCRKFGISRSTAFQLKREVALKRSAID